MVGGGKSGSNNFFGGEGGCLFGTQEQNSQFQTRQYLDRDIQFQHLLEIYIDLMLSWLLEFLSKVTPNASEVTKLFWNIDWAQAE